MDYHQNARIFTELSSVTLDGLPKLSRCAMNR